MKRILNNNPITPLVRGLDKITPLVLSSLGPDKGIIFCGGKIVSLYSGLLTLIKHEDPFENIAVRLLEDVAKDVYSKSGSGVGLSATLTIGLVREARKLLVSGYHPRQVHDWLQTIGVDFVACLTAEAAAVKKETWVGNEEFILKAIAATAARSEKIGDVVGSMCYKIGQFAHIDIVQDDIPNIRVEYRNGYTFHTNPLSYQFLKGKRKEFSSPKILFTDGQLDSVQPIVDVMVAANKAQAPLIIICNGVGRDVMSLLLHNLNIGSLDVMLLKSPAFSFGQFEALEDIAMITGGKPVSQAQRTSPTPEHLGTAPRVVVGQDYCTIYFAKPIPAVYIAGVEKRANKLTSDILRLQAHERVSNLHGQAAVLRVGGYTDKERQSEYQRVESTVHAVRGAQAEGYLPGGYQFFRRFLSHRRPEIPAPLYLGMEFPYNALMANYTGDVPASGRAVDNPVRLFNLRTGKVEDMLGNGVIDSAKSIRVAVESAISITKTLVLTGAIVTEA